MPGIANGAGLFAELQHCSSLDPSDRLAWRFFACSDIPVANPSSYLPTRTKEQDLECCWRNPQLLSGIFRIDTVNITEPYNGLISTRQLLQDVKQNARSFPPRAPFIGPGSGVHGKPFNCQFALIAELLPRELRPAFRFPDVRPRRICNNAVKPSRKLGAAFELI